MFASLKLGLICVSSYSMARTTGYEYKKKSGLEKGRDFNPGIQNRSGLTIDTTSPYYTAHNKSAEGTKPKGAYLE
jgi:hypothetical protein